MFVVILQLNLHLLQVSNAPMRDAGYVRGSYLARVPRSLLARVHRVFVLHIVEEEAEDQVDEKDDRREIGQQEEEGRVAENQTHNMSA